MSSEADTRANFTDPALAAAGRGPDTIIREHYFTDGRKLAEFAELYIRRTPADIFNLIPAEDAQVQTLLSEIGELLEEKS